MGCYCITLSKEASNLSTDIIPWVKYRYKLLPMGVSNYLDIIHEKMNEVFHGFELIWDCINVLLIITKGDWYDHLENWSQS